MIPKRIVVFGSSSVHGRGDLERGGFVHRFRLWHEAQSSQNFVYELGIFGETTDALIERVIREAPERRPNLIIIYPGFNDIRRNGGTSVHCHRSIEDFRISMEKLLKGASLISETLVMTGFPFNEALTSPYEHTNWHYFTSDAELYTETLRTVCAEQQVAILDYARLWEPLDWKALLAPDGLHCNSAGHQMLFEQLRDYLNNERGV